MYDDLIQFIRDWYRSGDFIPLHEPRFSNFDKEFVIDAIDSTFVSSVGEYVTRFERELAAYLGANYAVVTVNGTVALQLALKLAGVMQNTEVITQPLTFVATANAIVHNGAYPVFVDVNSETMGLCPEALEVFLDKNAAKHVNGTRNKMTGRRIAAIVPMHTFGHPCRMKRILEVAETWGIPVVEDAAEALGSSIAGRYCATIGKMGVLSFNGNKTITCGGGGAIITNDKNLAQHAKHLTTTAKIDHPWRFAHDEVGYNFRMPNLNAALACAQLTQLDSILADKRTLSAGYKEFFEAIEWADFVSEPHGCISNYWLNTIVVEDKTCRDDLLKKTNESGVMTRPAWELMTELKMYRDCRKGNLKNARSLADRIVNLPSSARGDV